MVLPSPANTCWQHRAAHTVRPADDETPLQPLLLHRRSRTLWPARPQLPCSPCMADKYSHACRSPAAKPLPWHCMCAAGQAVSSVAHTQRLPSAAAHRCALLLEVLHHWLAALTLREAAPGTARFTRMLSQETMSCIGVPECGACKAESSHHRFVQGVQTPAVAHIEFRTPLLHQRLHLHMDTCSLIRHRLYQSSHAGACSGCRAPAHDGAAWSCITQVRRHAACLHVGASACKAAHVHAGLYLQTVGRRLCSLDRRE